MKEIITIIYTTLYKKGGKQFKLVAETLAAEKMVEGYNVKCKQADSKADLLSLFNDFQKENIQIKELHVIGHSGMYGPMFGSEQYPEQLSPHELKELKIPFAKEALASFHSCRSARWFAPYFAQVQQVKTYGYHWYTTFSSRKERFSHPKFLNSSGKMYLFGCPGRKSHGLLTALKKRLGFVKPEQLKAFTSINEHIDTSYDNVADLYANTFKDIKVRRDEFNWIIEHFPVKRGVEMLDIGCGNGALLYELAPKLKKGVGIDASENLLNHAKEFNKAHSNLTFEKINKPELPFDNNSFDVVVSLLSLRYLDWDPIFKEINRVLKEDGKLIIIDMVTAPLKFRELPNFINGKLKHYLDRKKFPEFYQNLQKLVKHQDWVKMLHYNPIRSQHEMVNYLKSRYPSGSMKIINIGLHSRIIAFEASNHKT